MIEQCNYTSRNQPCLEIRHFMTPVRPVYRSPNCTFRGKLPLIFLWHLSAFFSPRELFTVKTSSLVSISQRSSHINRSTFGFDESSGLLPPYDSQRDAQQIWQNDNKGKSPANSSRPDGYWLPFVILRSPYDTKFVLFYAPSTSAFPFLSLWSHFSIINVGCIYPRNKLSSVLSLWRPSIRYGQFSEPLGKAIVPFFFTMHTSIAHMFLYKLKAFASSAEVTFTNWVLLYPAKSWQ